MELIFKLLLSKWIKKEIKLKENIKYYQKNPMKLFNVFLTKIILNYEN
jgi:hypothetical protein